MVSSTVTRLDEAGRYREVLEYVGTADGNVASCMNIPDGDIVGGVVICSSLYNEFLKNYRREVMLARALAARGIAVQRLHYRGTGHSDGMPTDTTLASMGEDAIAARARLREVAGTENVAYVGTRFGSLVAAGASGADGAPLALLEPVVEAERFFREGLRTILFSSVVSKGAGARTGQPTTVGTLVADLTEAGEIDVLGYTIGLDLYRSAAGVTLLTAMGPRPRPVLLAQLGADELRPELVRAVEALAQLGCEVATCTTGTREAWWFAEEEEEAPGELENRAHGLEDEDPVVDAIGTWLVANLDPGDPL